MRVHLKISRSLAKKWTYFTLLDCSRRQEGFSLTIWEKQKLGCREIKVLVYSSALVHACWILLTEIVQIRIRIIPWICSEGLDLRIFEEELGQFILLNRRFALQLRGSL